MRKPVELKQSFQEVKDFYGRKAVPEQCPECLGWFDMTKSTHCHWHPDDCSQIVCIACYNRIEKTGELLEEIESHESLIKDAIQDISKASKELPRLYAELLKLKK